MPDLKMLNSTKYLYKLTFIKCSYGAPSVSIFSSVTIRCRRAQHNVTILQYTKTGIYTAKVFYENAIHINDGMSRAKKSTCFALFTHVCIIFA